jgi:hypothetical protein
LFWACTLDQYPMPFQTTTMRASIVALLAGVAMGSVGMKGYRVSKAQPLGEMRCNFHDEGSSPSSTEPCLDFKPPAKVAIGESFSAEGLRRTIRFIVATQVEKDFQVPNGSIKKGQYFCVAAETTDDLAEGQAHRVWLFIPRCIPAQ